MRAQKRRRPRARVVYAQKCFELAGTQETYEVELAYATGGRVCWVYRGREYTYIMAEEGYLRRESSIRPPAELNALFCAISPALMRAVIRGYNWNRKPKAPAARSGQLSLRLI